MDRTTHKIRGRFAPSPSGRMHLGNIFCALLCWLSARALGGELVLRIEDLDSGRCTPERAKQLIADLEWLGLDWDYGPKKAEDFAPYYQSLRTENYHEAVAKLTDMGLVYPCYCSRAEIQAASAPHLGEGRVVYSGRCSGLGPKNPPPPAPGRNPALRLRLPDTDINFTDRLYGRQSQNLAKSCGDIIIRRTDGVYAYQLAVVVDDIAMGVNQVVRGRDLLDSVARQSFLCQTLGTTPPSYCHIPLLIAPDGRRLSKREADLDFGELSRRYPAPEVLVGRLAHMCGLLQTHEAASPQELVKIFDWGKISPKDIVVNPEEF